MKAMKKTLFLFLALMLIQILPAGMGIARTAQAAEGLVKEGGNYVFYEGGKKVLNVWKTVNVGKDPYGRNITQKMYFGSNGNAYKAATYKDWDGVSKYEMFTNKKVGTTDYGFNAFGFTVTKGVYVGRKNELFYYYNADGTRNVSYTGAMNKLNVYEAQAKPILDLLKKYGEVPVSTTTSSSCYKPGGTDVRYEFKNFVLCTYKDKAGEIFLNVESKDYVTTGWDTSKSFYTYHGITCTKLQKINNKLYYFDGNGKLVKDQYGRKIADTYYKIDANGVCTKVSEELGLAGIQVEKIGRGSSVGATLKKSFDWCAKNVKYVNVSGPTTAAQYAVWGFKNVGYDTANPLNTKGDCNVQAAMFTYMARAIGYTKMNYVKGFTKTTKGNEAHAWCEMMKGTDLYYYDPNIVGTKTTVKVNNVATTVTLLSWQFKATDKYHASYVK